VGRPITDFTHQLDYDGLVADARTVLDHLAPIEREIRSHKGGWYLARIRPYRTVDDKIDGVVATFIDVTERRQMEDALRTANAALERHINSPKPRKD
jgi:two-component system CheB/CheR fusion protein